MINLGTLGKHHLDTKRYKKEWTVESTRVWITLFA